MAILTYGCPVEKQHRDTPSSRFVTSRVAAVSPSELENRPVAALPETVGSIKKKYAATLFFYFDGYQWKTYGADAVEVCFATRVQIPLVFSRKGTLDEGTHALIDQHQLAEVLLQLLDKGNPVVMIDTRTGEFTEHWPDRSGLDTSMEREVVAEPSPTPERSLADLQPVYAESEFPQLATSQWFTTTQPGFTPAGFTFASSSDELTEVPF